jgi:predicted  nucleic acid-binding Zn-ribbon protein
MPHQCVRCSRIIPAGSEEILKGCRDCGSHFFFYIRDEQLEKLKQNPINIPEAKKEKIEKDVREIAGIEEETVPVILDIESVRVVGPGKFEIDVVNLFNEKRPIIYKLEEGKYIIDLATTLGKYRKDNVKRIDINEKENKRNPKKSS